MPTQSNHHFSFSISVACSHETAWSLLTNVDRWPEWNTELRSSALNSPFAEGARGMLVPKRGPKLSFEITAINPGTSYTFVTRMPVGSLVITRSLHTDVGLEPGTGPGIDIAKGPIVFTDDIAFTGPLKKLFGWLLGGGFRSVLPQVMNNFKRLAESGSGTEQTTQFINV